MGWGYGVDSDGREIGYNVASTCEFPGCTAVIHRGLAYACGGQHGADDERGYCAGYFCEAHLYTHDCPNERVEEETAPPDLTDLDLLYSINMSVVMETGKNLSDAALRHIVAMVRAATPKPT